MNRTDKILAGLALLASALAVVLAAVVNLAI